MSPTLRPLAAVAILTLLGAGCSNAPAPIAGNGSNITSNNAGGVHAQAVKFAECMRTNGVSAFPDPPASGSFTIDGVVNGSSLNPNSAAFQQALNTCHDLEPPGFTGPTRTPAQQSAALKFAQCVRAHGVTDFPDPAIGDPLVDTRRIPSAATATGRSELGAAMQKCRQFAAAAGVSGGR